RALKQAIRVAYRCEAADGEQSLTATAAAVASCHKDEFLEGVHHEQAERAQPTQGKNLEVKKGAQKSHVRIDIGNGNVITSAITNEAVADLNLKTGDEAWAVIKASDVMIGV